METALQLNVIIPNVPGNLATVSDKLRAANVNINAIACTEGSPTTIIHLIVDDVDTAKIVLQPTHKVSVTEVLAFKMKNKPGAIASIGRACAGAKLNIRNIYATSAGKEAMVYVVPDDIAKAKELLESWKGNFA